MDEAFVVDCDGFPCLVSPEDSDLAAFKWYPDADGYIIRYRRREKGKQRTAKMHRQIVERMIGRVLLPSEQVDHWNRDRRDNRRENLRLASNLENSRNQGKRPGANPRKGITWHKRAGKWQAHIRVGGGKRLYLGLFPTPEEAASAYNAAAEKYHGEFAALNA